MSTGTGFPDERVYFADTKHHLAIHREAPPFVDQSTEQEILVTGIKVSCAHCTSSCHGMQAYQGDGLNRMHCSISTKECLQLRGIPAGGGPSGPLPAWRQDWAVWRCRRGQDRAHHGAHQQCGQGPRCALAAAHPSALCLRTLIHIEHALPEPGTPGGHKISACAQVVSRCLLEWESAHVRAMTSTRR